MYDLMFRVLRLEVKAAVLSLALLPGLAGMLQAVDEETFVERRRHLVQELEAQGIQDRAVLAAIGAVPRHEFVPEALREFAYLNRPLPIGLDQTISQPYIVALMTELLELKAGQRVLEVGTGSGYQAGILAHLGVIVHTIEIVPELAERAARDLARLGFSSVKVYEGDGFLGYPDGAPFDAVIITCAVDRVPPPLVAQLKVGGRIVLPIGDELNYQDLKVVTKKSDSSLEYRSITGVIFVPMTGAHGHGKILRRDGVSPK